MSALDHPVDYEHLAAAAGSLASEFRAADPFPHVVIDNFLSLAACDALLNDFQRLQDPDSWGHYIHYTERKLAMRDHALMGAGTRAIIDELSSPRFIAWLERITGIAGMLPDPELDGGGLHLIPSGGHLNVHVDYLAHPTQRTWSRQLNLLLYLNTEWQPAWNGSLEFWDAEMTHCVKAIAPVFNRCVIFHTQPGSYHGHPTPLACPPEVSRKSLALYYFRDEHRALSVVPTHYHARPDDNATTRAMIWLDRQMLAVHARLKRMGLRDGIVQKILKRF